MALKAKIDNLDEIPEALREHYAEKDGGYILNVESVGGLRLENVDALRKTATREREVREAVAKQLKAFGKLNIGDDGKVSFEADLDPEAARDALTKVKDGWKPPKDVEEAMKRTRDELEQKFRVQLEERDKSAQQLEGQLNHLLIDGALQSAIGKHKGRAKLLIPALRPMLKLEKLENGREVRVVDGDGTPRFTTKDGKSVPMDVDDLVAEIKQDKDFMSAFEGSAAVGSGAPGSGGGSAVPVNNTDTNLSPVERLRGALANGPTRR